MSCRLHWEEQEEQQEKQQQEQQQELQEEEQEKQQEQQDEEGGNSKRKRTFGNHKLRSGEENATTPPKEPTRSPSKTIKPHAV